MMFDTALRKDLIEMMGKSLTFNDIEAIGGYLFNDLSYRTHSEAGVDKKVSISPLNAAKTLVAKCESKKILKDLFAFVFELDGAPLNGRNVELEGLDNILYQLSQSGVYYDFASRKFVEYNREKASLPNWGVLRNGKEYEIAVASADICDNSELVRRYKPRVMEQVYFRLWEFIRRKLAVYGGRMWSWAGDGGLFAFRGAGSVPDAVSCCLEILYALPVFNMRADKPIKDQVSLRIGMDFGLMKYFEDTGKIVSDVINYAAHLEKKGTSPMCVSVSDRVYAKMHESQRMLFKKQKDFEGRPAYSTK
jgi:class 3 adenylate cyclase